MRKYHRRCKRLHPKHVNKSDSSQAIFCRNGASSPQQAAGETDPTAPSRMKKLTNAVTVPADACKYFEQPKRLVLDCSSIKLERITSTHYPASSNGCSPSLRLLRLAYQRTASPTHAMNPIALATTTAACAAPVQHDHAHRASPSEHVCATAGDADAMSDRMNAAATPALQPNPVCGTYSPPPPEAPLVAAEYFSNSVPFISQLRRAALKYLRRMLQKDREGRTRRTCAPPSPRATWRRGHPANAEQQQRSTAVGATRCRRPTEVPRLRQKWQCRLHASARSQSRQRQQRYRRGAGECQPIAALCCLDMQKRERCKAV